MNETSAKRARATARQFALGGAIVLVEPFGNGRINETFLVTTEGGAQYVLQQVNPIFAPSVLDDINVLTRAMKEAGMATAELVLTKNGELGIVENNECWRMLTYIPGRTKEDGVTEEEARSAMGLIGRFHQTFQTHDHDFHHVREGFHDTPRIMKTLEQTMREYAGTKKDAALAPLVENILRAYGGTRHAWAHLPKRIIHGDPKLNNIRFAENSSEAVALLDLDTLGRHSIVIDIADAARSWANRADEGDEKNARFDLHIFRAMMSGYLRKAKFLTKEERFSIPDAIAQITLELAARFANDAIKEKYFKLEHVRYSNLFTQNSAKSSAQLALYGDICKKFSEIMRISNSSPRVSKNPSKCSA